MDQILVVKRVKYIQIRSKRCNYKNQKQYYLLKLLNDNNNDQEDEINSYGDLDNVGDNGDDDDKISQFEANPCAFELLEIAFLKFPSSPLEKIIIKCPPKFYLKSKISNCDFQHTEQALKPNLTLKNS